jgi:hypothetical protein
VFKAFDKSIDVALLHSSGDKFLSGKRGEGLIKNGISLFSK